MSVAIVALINHTALEIETELVDDECPETDYGNVTVSDILKAEINAMLTVNFSAQMTAVTITANKFCSIFHHNMSNIMYTDEKWNAT